MAKAYKLLFSVSLGSWRANPQRLPYSDDPYPYAHQRPSVIVKKKAIAPSPALSGVGVTRPRPGARLNPLKGI
jgi:hypothetical protein